MAQIADTYQEVLTLLKENEKTGLTTAQILSAAKKHRMLLIRDSTQISSIVYYLRGKKLVTTHQASGGKIHKITESGLALLHEDKPEQASPPDEKTEEPAPGVDTIVQTEPEPAPVEASGSAKMDDDEDEDLADPESNPDPLQAFDDAVLTIRIYLDELLNAQEPIKITDKARKLATLENLAAMPIFTQDLADMLSAIKSDLEQLDSA